MRSKYDLSGADEQSQKESTMRERSRRGTSLTSDKLNMLRGRIHDDEE